MIDSYGVHRQLCFSFSITPTLPTRALAVSLILQVEYRPCNRVADGLSMIEAFIPSIDQDGTFTAVSDLQDLAMFGRGPQFSVKHNALQITDLFNKVFA